MFLTLFPYFPRKIHEFPSFFPPFRQVGDMAQLYAAMEAAQLAELVPLAEEWCQEQGAELLEEADGWMDDDRCIYIYIPSAPNSL